MSLTALSVKNSKPGDRLGDGDGLWLFVDKKGNRSWVLRYTSPLTKKPREMGLGAERDIKLAEARDARDDARKLLREGKDPIEDRNARRTAAQVDASRTVTFKAYALEFIAEREAGWKNPVHRQQWRNTLQDYAYPHIGQMAVADVDIHAVLAVLRPIWTEKPETARRVRGRIESILNAAKAEKKRTGENPALWRGNLDQLLARRKKSDVKHHPALPYDEMPGFWKSLVADTSDAARMLRWIILTACRFGEAADINVTSEVKGDLWTIPANRMKADRPHTVPLTPLALAQIPFRPVSDVTLGNCIARHTETPATTHGMRSTFRDWCGDCTHYPRDVAEAALAHTLSDDTEAAYRRSTALAKRRELMTVWATYCASAPQ